MDTKIEVTQDDIAHGRPCDRCGCPVAQAIMRKVKHGQKVFVGSEHALIGLFGKDSYCQSINFPENVKKFILDFDHHEPVVPFSFSLDISANNLV